MATTLSPFTTNARRYHINGFMVDVDVRVFGDDLRLIAQDMIDAVNEPYREVAKQEIRGYYSQDDKFVVIADGRTQQGVTEATLDGSIVDKAVAVGRTGSRGGSGITTSRGFSAITPQLLADVRRAYEAARSHLATGISNFFRPTGAYEASVTVLQSGRRVTTPNWTQFAARSNITIVPFGPKYANALEVLKAGQLLYGAALAARAVSPNIVVNFSYRSSRSIGLGGNRGSFPVLEIGLRGSSVIDSITPPGQKRRANRRSRRRNP